MTTKRNSLSYIYLMWFVTISSLMYVAVNWHDTIPIETKRCVFLPTDTGFYILQSYILGQNSIITPLLPILQSKELFLKYYVPWGITEHHHRPLLNHILKLLIFCLETKILFVNVGIVFSYVHLFLTYHLKATFRVTYSLLPCSECDRF
jgi:hypothetical protein